ncbi:MAG: isochorismate synthase [Calditrichota bacterium]
MSIYTSQLRYFALSHSIESAYPLDAFAASNPTLFPAFLWQDRETREPWLGLGWAGVFSSLSECRNALTGIETAGNALPFAPRCFGIAAFPTHDDPLPSPWGGFQARLFVLPEMLARFRNGGAEFLLIRPVLESVSPDDAEVECACRLAEVRLVLENRQDRNHRVITNSGENDSREQWIKAVEDIRRRIDSRHVQKVVLARSEWRAASEPWNLALLLERLSAESDGCTLFGHRLSDDAFIGATPERLFRVRGNTIETESLAGTRPRGSNINEEQNFADQLRHSDKDNIEQSRVTEFLRIQLNEFCSSVEVSDQPSSRTLRTVQHLLTPLTGTLKDGITLDDILTALHPTPAVGGLPRAAALEMIASSESLPRGLYAGAMGWVSRDEAEFVVTIRSGLIAGTHATVFAGAGIVEDSDPQLEWEETVWKMQPLLRALEG